MRILLCLLSSAVEYKHQNCRMSQRYPGWRMETSKENMTSTKGILQKQRHLEKQVIEEIEQLWEETQRARNEAASLKKITKQQQDVINVLMAEKHKRGTLIEELRLQLENVIGKLKEYKADACREKNQLQKIQETIDHEREALERQYLEIKTQQDKLVHYVQTQSRGFRGLEEPLEENKQRQELKERMTAEGLLNLIQKNKKIMLETNRAKEQMEKTMTDIKQELKRNEKYLMQQKSTIKHMKHSVNVSINKMKQRWTEMRDVHIQDVPVAQIESQTKDKEGSTKFYTANKLFTILEEKKKLWEVLEITTEQQDLTEGVGMDSSEADARRVIRQDKESEFAETSVETNKENEVSTGMQRVILEVEGIRKMLRRVREDSDQSKREILEEKNQIKWMNFRAKKQRRVLEHQLERKEKERDDLELVKMKIQQQKEEAGKKLHDMLNAFLRMGEIKAAMQKAAAEIHHTGEEMLKAQTLMKESSNEAEKLKVSRLFFSSVGYFSLITC